VPYLKKAGLLVAGKTAKDKLQKIVEVSNTRMKKLSDIVELSDFFFADKLNYEKQLLKWDNMQDEDIKEAFLLCDKILSELKSWEIKKIEKALLDGAGEFNKQKGYFEQNRGFLLWPLRAALSGKKASPSPFEIADILGREKTLARIKQAMEKI
jgi:glutamyl/glutaminyl-tRNA synthetase